MVNEQLGKNERLVAMSVDLKAAFNSIKRKILTDTMWGTGMKEGITERVAELLRETKSKVRVEGETGSSFWTTKDARQGCPLNPLRFNQFN